MPRRLIDDHSWAEIAELFADRIEEKKFLSGFKRKHFVPWFMEREKLGLRFDWKMVARCYKISKDQTKEHDHFILVVGDEGEGKSTFIIQVLAWISPGMNLDDVCYNLRRYIKKLKRVTKDFKAKILKEDDKSVCIDEGGIDLYSKDAMRRSNKTLGKTFLVQRFLRLAVGICIPYYQAIDKIVRQHRVDTLIIIKKRGYYKAIVGKGINILNKTIKGHDDRVLQAVAIPYGYFFEGSFTKDFPNTMDKAEYEKNKLDYIEIFLDEIDKDLNASNKAPEEVKMIKLSKVAKNLGCSTETLKRKIQNKSLKGKKIGYNWFIPIKEYNKLTETEIS